MRIIHAIAFLVASICAVNAATEIEKEENVLVLTDDNFQTALKEHELLLVEFYAPWCGHCKKLAPEYAKAATELAKLDPPLYIAKLDATEHREAPKPYGVRGFPSIKLFRKGEPQDYFGDRTAEALTKFMIKKSGPPIVTIKSTTEAEDFLKTNKEAGIGFFSSVEDTQAQALLAYAAAHDTYQLAYTAEQSVMDKYSAKPGSLTFFVEDSSASRPLESDQDIAELSDWLHGHSIPVMFTYSQADALKLFGGNIKVHQLAFLDEDQKADYDKYAAAIKAAGEKRRTEHLTISIPKAEHRVMEAFGLKSSDLPALVFADMRSKTSPMKKYVYSGDMSNSKDIEQWATSFFEGNLKPTLKSEEPSEEDDAHPVKIIKGKSFKEKVLDSDKDVLVEFYAPWCGHCKSLEPIYEKLATNLQDLNDVVIAKMDATANEIDVPGVDVRGFPTILLFPSGGKDTPISFNKAREVPEFIKFLKENGTKSFDNLVVSDADETAADRDEL